MPEEHEPTSREQHVDEVIAAYLEAERLGQAPDREAWLAEHPALRPELQSFLADRDRFQRLAGPPPAEAPTLAPGEPAPPPQPGVKIRYFGDYELLEEIARGGMGVVYLANQVSLRRMVALKMILAGHLASPADVRRFRTEA